MKKSAVPPPPPAAGEPKERVLHTRIPESLDEAIRAHAAGLGMSVSNLVRNVLANALEVVEAAAGLAPSSRASAGGPPVVLGWQEAVLARNAVCQRCNQILPRGSKAAIAVVDRDGGGAPRPIRCLACLEELDHANG
jgi:hypothetical protein